MIMKCLACKSENMVNAKEAYFAEVKNHYVIIKNVPCYKCENCGEVFYTMSVTERINEILDDIELALNNSEVYVCDYTNVA